MAVNTAQQLGEARDAFAVPNFKLVAAVHVGNASHMKGKWGSK